MRRQDCGQITDGACAVVLARREFAAEHARACGAQLARCRASWAGATATPACARRQARAQRRRSRGFPHVRDTIADAFRRAGIADVRESTASRPTTASPSTEYMAIDHFGITAPGQSWQAVESGLIERGGTLPMNRAAA